MIFGKAINRYYLKHAPVLLLGILSLLTVDYIQLLIPELYRLVINGVNLGQVVVDGQTLPFTREVLFQHICLPMIWIVVLMVIGRFLWRVCFFGSAVSVAADLRERMFDHSRRLSQQYYQVNKVGNLMSLYTNDLDTIQECFGDGILMFFDAAVLGIMALVKMWRMDCKLTLLALIPAAVMFVLGTVMSQVMTRRWEERQQAFSDLSDFAQENFSGIAVIKAFVKELKELIAFRRLNKENEEVNVAYTKIATLLEVLVTLFVESVICVILGYGGWLVWRGQFNAGQLVEYIGYFEAIVWPIMAISMLIEKTSRGKASLNRITELLDAPIDVADRDGVADLRDPHGGIEFRHLTFRYPDGEYDVLKDVSFTIKPGESVGIVGKTGAGKTALVDLLLRTYNVPDGTLFVDGQDVNAVSIHSVRDACAYVPQDNFLFSDTIAHNIGFGVDDAMRKRYNVAASRAKDQLWVVHSLDAANDLKPGDMRKRLIDYAADPHAAEVQHGEIKAHAESPFERAVAEDLTDRGYHLVQQWAVGAYRLDMVALCGKQTAAIECDGERWHSGAEKVREDMERQTILERLGWRFIRIRGSEYYRAPEKTMERVISQPPKTAVQADKTPLNC